MGCVHVRKVGAAQGFSGLTCALGESLLRGGRVVFGLWSMHVCRREDESDEKGQIGVKFLMMPRWPLQAAGHAAGPRIDSA